MIENIFVLFAITYIVSLVAGFLIERYLRIPWIFAALFFGIILSNFGYFSEVLKQESFQTLSTLGMIIILFLIGFNLDLNKLKKLKNDVIKGSITIIFSEAITVSLLLYLFFPSTVNNSYTIALLVALSFATVGEAILLPILKEFKVINTTFGQLTLGIGTVDNVIEVITLVSIGLILLSNPSLSSSISSLIPSPEILFVGLISLVMISLLLIKLGNEIKKIIKKVFPDYTFSYLVVLVVFFSFVAISGAIYEDLIPVAAILSGIVTRYLVPKHILKDYSHIIDFVGYVFLAPFFFLSIGTEVSVDSIIASPILIIVIWIVAKGSKLFTTYALFRKLLGTKYSLLMGLGLSIRFSTSLIVQYILYTNGLITSGLYSALIATAILMKFVIIYLLSWGLSSGKPP